MRGKLGEVFVGTWKLLWVSRFTLDADPLIILQCVFSMESEHFYEKEPRKICLYKIYVYTIYFFGRGGGHIVGVGSHIPFA